MKKIYEYPKRSEWPVVRVDDWEWVNESDEDIEETVVDSQSADAMGDDVMASFEYLEESH